ncbi:hypothetical protein BDB00DRAFT_827856 [Zychaea mexicana]|uniref:uncharacterized protein n=1 Tax=Zychaea mexicana TaxID=64656 RepID=UPI0022FE482E|nr:uncharacterized protein BDB00DRAFT_827856 [Zychaea mexicana]KAI9492540.1 hypothetical protein BDB00DRAFT_827856 [Zychaea mexicana]
MELHEQGVGGVLQQKLHTRVETFPSAPSKQQQHQQQQQPPPRIDNIAHLYSQLQAAFDKPPTTTKARNATPVVGHPTPIKPARVNISHMPHQQQQQEEEQQQQRTSSSSSSDVPGTTRSSTESGFYTPSNSSSNTNSPITPSPHHHHHHHHHSNENPKQQLPDVCACHHWLVSIDSEHCGLCDEPLPQLQEWQQERNLGFQTIERSESQLQRLQEKQREYQEQIQQLVTDIHNKEASIERRTVGLESLQQDLKILHNKCKGERMQVKEIQQSKESVKRELEELSQRLFEEANEMVQFEKEEKKRIQVEHEKSKQQLEEAETELSRVEAELQTLRKDIGLLVESMAPPPPRPSSALSGYCESQSSSSNNYNAAAGDDHHSTSNSDTPVLSSGGSMNMGAETVMMRAQIDLAVQHNNSNMMALQIEASEDDHCLMEFRQFIDTASTVSLRKLHSMPYMKQCLEDDVRPTLRFGPTPKLASRKIIDAILVKTCFVETCPPGFVHEHFSQQQNQAAAGETITSLWERFASSPVFEGCQACGRQVPKEEQKQVLTYRFRTSYFDEWACIDRYCRDRLEAVVQFYSFLRQLRIGAYRHRSLTEVYQECSRLRLQMCLSRMGALPAVLQSSGFDPDVLARATPGSSNIGHLVPDDVNSARLSSSTASTLTL